MFWLFPLINFLKLPVGRNRLKRYFGSFRHTGVIRLRNKRDGEKRSPFFFSENFLRFYSKVDNKHFTGERFGLFGNIGLIRSLKTVSFPTTGAALHTPKPISVPYRKKWAEGRKKANKRTLGRCMYRVGQQRSKKRDNGGRYPFSRSGPHRPPHESLRLQCTRHVTLTKGFCVDTVGQRPSEHFGTI